MAERLTQDPRLWRVLVVASIAMFAINVDFFTVQATLPAMAEDFLLIGAVIFGLGSLGAGVASFPEMVIIMRIVQGLGAAIMMPVSIAVVTNALPADKTQRAVGLVFAIAAIGQALGPLIGGGLTEWASWRWVLWANIPVVAALAVLTLTSVEESRDETVPRSIDWTGLLLAVASIATVTFGIDKAADWGWTAPSTIGLIVSGVVGLVLFVLSEARTAYPILDLASVPREWEW